jgi:hypothetical protein
VKEEAVRQVHEEDILEFVELEGRHCQLVTLLRFADLTLAEPEFLFISC